MDSIAPFLILVSPVISSLTCAFMLLLPSRMSGSKSVLAARRVLLVYFIVAGINWLSSIVHVYFPDHFTYIRLIVLAFYLLTAVLLYHFAFLLTKTQAGERFSLWHYIVPFLFVGVCYLIRFLVPSEVPIVTSVYLERKVAGYEWYYSFLYVIIFSRIVWGGCYSLLCLFRYFRYRRVVSNYSANLYNTSLEWMRIFLILVLGYMVVSVWSLMVPFRVVYSSYLMLIMALLLISQHVVMCFNMVRGNYYLLIAEEDDPSEIKPTKTNDPIVALTPKRFLSYMEKDKPYLNPDLTIVDMACDLQTNRTYLSTFINQEYQMNFSRLINAYRLKELDRLLSIADDTDLSVVDLIYRVGFGSYQSYQRAKKQKNK